ncbi:MAG: FAD-dependent thymidylate synthase, partial [Actinomycetota bacterium]|nr:FAD-dependent thymidylate synthase [Actinomycetota bacterium]
MADEITFRSDVTVELVRASASDADVVFAARVSTAGEQSLDDIDADPEKSSGLVNYLMRDRHGSPFEHNSMTFFVRA